MSFADDIRKSFVEKPKTPTVDPNHLTNLAKKTYNTCKEALEKAASNGKSKEVYDSIGIIKKKCIEHAIGIEIFPGYAKKEYGVIQGWYDGEPAGLYAFNKIAVHKFYNILKQMASEDGITVTIEKSIRSYNSYIIYFRIYLGEWKLSL